MKQKISRPLLREIRKTFGTQQVVAKELNITRQFLGMIETGDRNPTAKLMAKMEHYFGIPANKLFPDIFFDQKCHNSKQNKSA